MIFFSFSFIELTFQFFCQKISHRIVKTESYVSTGNLGRKIYFFEKTLAALIVFGSERKNFGLLENFLGRVVQTVFDLSMGSIWEVSLKKKPDTFYYSRTLSKPFSAFSRKFSSRVVRKNYLKFQSLPDIEPKVFFLLSKKMQQWCQNCILRVYRNSLNETFLEKRSSFSFILFGHWAKKFWLFINFFSKELSKVFSTYPWEHFHGKFFL